DLDDLNRIKSIQNLKKGSNYPGSTVFPDLYEVLHNEFRGLRKSKTIFGNNSSVSYAFDGSGRIIQIEHLAVTDSLIIQHLYDAGQRESFYDYKNQLTRIRDKATNQDVTQFLYDLE